MTRSIFSLYFVLVAVLVLAPGACSDDENGGKDKGVPEGGADLEPDIGSDQKSKDIDPDGKAPPVMGLGCTDNTQCSPYGLSCILYTKAMGYEKTAGFCSKTCTEDDTTTPMVNEDTCYTGYMCVDLGTPWGKYCFKKCTVSATNPCPSTSKQNCHPFSTAYSGSTTDGLCLFMACESAKDCPVYSPTTCATDSECASVASDAFCDNKKCAVPGKCDTKSGICGAHTRGKSGSTVGDPCTSDLDCPNNGQCFEETAASTSTIGKVYSNGYCIVRNCYFATILTDFVCPTGSVCHKWYYSGLCFKSCKLDDATTCRNHSKDVGGDYECYAYDNWSDGSGGKATDTPVCMSTATHACDKVPGASSGYTCSGLGDSTNSTKMSCRDRYTGVAKSSASDPTGVCLDNTASGTFKPVTMDGGVEAGVEAGVDGGVPDLGPGPDAAVVDLAQQDQAGQ